MNGNGRLMILVVAVMLAALGKLAALNMMQSERFKKAGWLLLTVSGSISLFSIVSFMSLVE